MDRFRTPLILLFVLLAVGGLAYWQTTAGGNQTAATAVAPTPAAEPLLPPINPRNIRRITVRDPADGHLVQFAHDGNFWLQTEPVAEIVGETAGQPTRQFLGIRSTDQFPPDDLALYELADPPLEIVLQVADPTAAAADENGLVAYRFDVGRVAPSGEAVYMRVADDERIHIVPVRFVGALLSLHEQMAGPPMELPSKDADS